MRPNTKQVKELVEKKFGKCVTLKDISNLKTKVKEQTRKGLEEPQLLLSTLQNITTTQDAQAGIVVNENRASREGGARGATAPVKKFWRGLAPLKLFNSIIRDTLIEQSRSRYSNRAVTVFFEEQCSKL